MECRHCGHSFTPKYKRYSTFCSRDCGFMFSALNWKPPEPENRCCDCQAVIARQRLRCNKCSRRHKREHAQQKHRSTYTPAPRIRKPCKTCGTTIYERGYMAFCKRCHADNVASNRSKHAAIRRQREKQAYIERVSRRKVFERDQWTCRLCNTRLIRTVQVPHPKAATIDHIVPLSKGGKHSYKNVQAAHFECNSAKRDLH